MTLTIDLGMAGKTIVVALFAAVFVFAVVNTYRNIRRYFASRAFERGDRELLKRRWSEIEKMAAQPGEMGRRMAILEADKLLDNALMRLAFGGTTLAERLKYAQYKYPDLREVGWAHGVRNRLAHDVAFHLEAGTARRALKSFERALQRLGAI
jgi:hypothetical protein